jgi:hypothetical protein
MACAVGVIAPRVAQTGTIIGRVTDSVRAGVQNVAIQMKARASRPERMWTDGIVSRAFRLGCTR